MKKKQKHMLILFLLLLILIAGNFILQSILTSNEARKEEEEARMAEESVIHVETLQNITAMEIETDNQAFAFVYDAETAQWMYSDDETCPLNQELLSQFSSSMSSLTATREFTEPDTLDSYGLSAPSAAITLTGDDGQKITYQIGDKLSLEYYFKCSDNTTVYTVSSDSVSYAFNSLADFIAPLTMPDILNNNLTHFYVSSGTDSLEMTFRDDSWHYTSTELAGETLNATAVNDMIYALSDFTQSACVDYSPTDEAYEEYGLNHPYLTFTLDYTDENNQKQSITVKVGNTTDSSSERYYQTDDSPIISTVKNTLVTEIVNYITCNYIQTEEEAGASVTEITE